MTLTVGLIQTPIMSFFSTAGIGYMKKLKNNYSRRGAENEL